MSFKRLCPSCCQRKLYYRNGIITSKFCTICRKQKKLEKKQKHSKTKGAQEGLRKKLHKKAWGLMSEFVRRSASIDGQTLGCYTCNKWITWREAHCSHFHHGKLDFDERNLRVCCSGCNTYKHGNLAVYATKLVVELTPEGMEKLYLDANIKGNNYSIAELESIIIDLEQKLKELDFIKI